jgi:hypothetical protein
VNEADGVPARPPRDSANRANGGVCELSTSAPSCAYPLASPPGRRSIYLRGTKNGLFRPPQLGYSVKVCELRPWVGERGSSREGKLA